MSEEHCFVDAHQEPDCSWSGRTGHTDKLWLFSEQSDKLCFFLDLCRTKRCLNSPFFMTLWRELWQGSRLRRNQSLSACTRFNQSLSVCSLDKEWWYFGSRSLAIPSASRGKLLVYAYSSQKTKRGKLRKHRRLSSYAKV